MFLENKFCNNLEDFHLYFISCDYAYLISRERREDSVLRLDRECTVSCPLDTLLIDTLPIMKANVHLASDKTRMYIQTSGEMAKLKLKNKH